GAGGAVDRHRELHQQGNPRGPARRLPRVPAAQERRQPGGAQAGSADLRSPRQALQQPPVTTAYATVILRAARTARRISREPPSSTWRLRYRTFPSPTRPRPAVRFRLSLLMFLQYAAPGAFLPLYSVYLQKLGYDPFTVGCFCATQGFAAVLCPLLAGQIAGRWVSPDPFLAVCSFFAGAVLLLLRSIARR